MAKVFGSIGGAFSYATNNTFKKPITWILVAVVAVIELIAAVIGFIYLIAGIVGNSLTTAIKELIKGFGFDNLLAIFPDSNAVALIAIGVIALIISIVFGLFLCGLQIKIYSGKEVTFSGFFSTVGRGFQNNIICLIYQIVVAIIAFALSIGTISLIDVLGAFTAVLSGANVVPFITIVSAWSILLIVLAIIFSIFMYPALINFARQGKFKAAFQFKKIGAMISTAKWYKILAAIIVLAILVFLLSVILCGILLLLNLIPGVAGDILALIVLVLGGVYLFFLGTSYWAKFFEEIE